MVGNVGVVGINSTGNLFGIPGTPSIGGIIKRGISLIPGIGPIAEPIVGTLFPGAQPVRPVPLRPTSSCVPPFFFNAATGKCELDIIPGPGGGGTGPVRDPVPVGDAAVGRFGVGMQPGIVSRTVRVCLDGMQLAKDGLCYNKGAITNAQRAWPKGRRPLLTGGEMAAISKASRAAGRLERTTKRLQKIGLVKKPTSRRAPRPAAGARRVAGGVEVVNVS